MSRYQWLLFDADGTLFDYERSETVALTRAFAEFGSALDANSLAAYQRINAALWQALERGEVTPAIIKVRRFTQWFEAIGVTHSPEAFSARYLECLAECSELLADAAEVVQALREKYRMAILTNGLKLVQTGRLARSAIRPHIDQMIISEEIGFSKPAKGFFDVALARLGQPDRRNCSQLAIAGLPISRAPWTTALMPAGTIPGANRVRAITSSPAKSTHCANWSDGSDNPNCAPTASFLITFLAVVANYIFFHFSDKMAVALWQSVAVL